MTLKPYTLNDITKTTCPQGYVHGTCSNGHHFAKEIYCGREWCPTCGEFLSATHKRRIARWIPKGYKFSNMCYLVFTIPIELRKYYMSKQRLNYLIRRITSGIKSGEGQCEGILTKLGYDFGLARFHLFGTLSHVYNPHLNVLIEGNSRGRIPKKHLALLKKQWANLLGCQTVSVRAEPRIGIGRMYHSIEYISRPVWLNQEWYPELIDEFRGWKQFRTWGNFKELPDRWKLYNGTGELSRLISFYHGKCPTCDGNITWSGWNPIEYLLLNNLYTEDLGSGFYSLHYLRSP